MDLCSGRQVHSNGKFNSDSCLWNVILNPFSLSGLYEPDTPEPTPCQQGNIFFQAQSLCSGQHVLEYHIQPRYNVLGDHIQQAAESCRLAPLEKLVQYQHPPTRFQHASGFTQAGLRVRNDCENQVQYHVVETFVRKRQGHAVATDKIEVKVASTGFCAIEHRGCEVQTQVMMTGGKIGEIEPRTDATDED